MMLTQCRHCYKQFDTRFEMQTCREVSCFMLIGEINLHSHCFSIVVHYSEKKVGY